MIITTGRGGPQPPRTTQAWFGPKRGFKMGLPLKGMDWSPNRVAVWVRAGLQPSPFSFWAARVIPQAEGHLEGAQLLTDSLSIVLVSERRGATALRRRSPRRPEAGELLVEHQGRSQPVGSKVLEAVDTNDPRGSCLEVEVYTLRGFRSTKGGSVDRKVPGILGSSHEAILRGSRL